MGRFEQNISKEITALTKCFREFKLAYVQNSSNTDPSSLVITNSQAEVADTGTITLSGVSNYSYSIVSGSAEVTINGVTISGLPTGFEARQGDTTPNPLLNDITITGESLGTRVIIYYETIA